jgi:divalent metal cation (Fe/Co/Zn/Cd) transporter
VSLLIFAIGAGVSIYQGVRHVIAPVEIEHPYVNYIVLGLAAVFEGGSWLVALREFRADKGELGYLEAAQESKDPAIFMLLFEDSAALTGILLAFAGTGAAQALDLPVLDGVASIAIGVLLAAVAGFLARESKDLLMGERAHVELESSICRMAREEAGIEHANSILTVHLGPRQVVAALSLDFADTLSAAEVKAAVARLEARIRRAHPEVVMVLVKPQDVEDFRAWKGRRRRSRPHSQSGQGRPFSRRNAGFQSLER